MRVALLTDGIHPYVIGGMQMHSFYLAKYLSLNGVGVDLYHTPFYNNRTPEMEQLNCFSHSEKTNINPILIDFPIHKHYPGHYLKESYEYACRIFEIFKNRSKVDFVYAKGFAPWKLLEEKAKGYQSPPIGINFHGYEMFQKNFSISSFLNQLLFRRTVKSLIGQSDYVFSYGAKITDLVKKLNTPLKKIIEIPTGIEPSWLVEAPKPLSSKRKLLFIGRYEERKGLKELTKAIHEFDIGKFDFHFIGNIPEDKKIHRSDVYYHGMIKDKKETQRLMRSCDVMVCPSYAEGMPNVILEAMASGLAIIATDVGAVSLLVSHKNGWLIEKPSVDIIKSSIDRVLNCEAELLLKMKTQSISTIKEKYLWNIIIIKLIDKIKLLSAIN